MWKLICQKIIPFENVPRELWIQFCNKEEFEQRSKGMYQVLNEYDGTDEVVIYLKEEKAIKRFGKNRRICINNELLSKLNVKYGKENVRIVEKSIEK